MAQVAVKPTPNIKETSAKAKSTYNRNTVAEVYLKTRTGVVILIGKDGDEIRKHIESSKSPLDYRFFDDDKKRWAYWAVKDTDGSIKPPHFPSVTEYALTSLQLYAKAVTYPLIVADTVALLDEKPPTLWDKAMKPTTIIMAIVGIVFVMGLMLTSLTG